MLVIYLSFISPLCGVAQTPDCGIVNLFATFRGVISDTRSVHSIFYSRIACSYFLCMRASQTFVADVVIIIISEHDCPLLYYTRVLNVCEYIQTYSLACPWLLSWPDFLRGEERYDDSPGTHVKVIAASRR